MVMVTSRARIAFNAFVAIDVCISSAAFFALTSGSNDTASAIDPDPLYYQPTNQSTFMNIEGSTYSVAV
jgi:phosphate/sulfate permease